MAILLVKSAKKQGECVATRPTQPKLSWAGKEEVKVLVIIIPTK